ncbi:hypothetical protein FQN57_005777 [Myotisia sp. PD_48]|nr:hypothetical protein FQN57_005777 [Myotisia sp. PD_48]
MQNSNPTILSVADLPSRKPAAASPSKASAQDGTIFAHSWSSDDASSSQFFVDPFSDPEVPGSPISEAESEGGELWEEPIDEQEIYDLIYNITDPEHPISLGELAVVSLPDISIKPALPNNPSSPLRLVTVLITPTITGCGLSTVIGLGVRIRLEQSLPPRFRLDVRIKEGTHRTADETNKQLADKERVAAALENDNLMMMVNKMLETCD